MKAAYYLKAGDGKIADLPIPEVGDDEVLIEVVACSICKGAELGHATTGTGLAKYPVVPGHEFAGIVSKIGKDVLNCKVGDRVTADNTVPCGVCQYCQAGDPNHCENFNSLGHSVNGGFAEYTKVTKDKIFHLPDDMPFEIACMTESVACCIHAMDRLAPKFGETVVVFGDGPNGLIIAELCAHSNARKVVLVGRHEEKLELVKPFGIIPILSDRNGDGHFDQVKAMFPGGVDAVVDATGNSASIAKCFALLKRGGRIMQYSVPGPGAKVEVDSMDLFERELTYYATSCQANCFDRALAAMEDGEVDLAPMITGRYQLDDYFKAIEVTKTDRKQIKTVIFPGEKR